MDFTYVGGPNQPILVDFPGTSTFAEVGFYWNPLLDHASETETLQKLIQLGDSAVVSHLGTDGKSRLGYDITTGGITLSGAATTNSVGFLFRIIGNGGINIYPYVIIPVTNFDHFTYTGSEGITTGGIADAAIVESSAWTYVSEGIISFTASLTGSQMVPDAVITANTAIAEITINYTTGLLTLTATNTVPDATDILIGRGIPGEPLENVFSLNDFFPSFDIPVGAFTNSVTLPTFIIPVLLNSLENGSALIITSTTYPEGEIRGQLIFNHGQIYTSLLDSKAIVKATDRNYTSSGGIITGGVSETSKNTWPYVVIPGNIRIQQNNTSAVVSFTGVGVFSYTPTDFQITIDDSAIANIRSYRTKGVGGITTSGDAIITTGFFTYVANTDFYLASNMSGSLVTPPTGSLNTAFAEFIDDKTTGTDFIITHTFTGDLVSFKLIPDTGSAITLSFASQTSPTTGTTPFSVFAVLFNDILASVDISRTQFIITTNSFPDGEIAGLVDVLHAGGPYMSGTSIVGSSNHIYTTNNTNSPVVLTGSADVVTGFYVYIVGSSPTIFSGPLDSDQPVTSPNITSGSGSYIILSSGNQINWSISYTGIFSLSSFTINGPANYGENGPVVINIPVNSSYNPTTSEPVKIEIGSTTLTTTQLGYLNNETLYINIGSVRDPSGAMRGQIIHA